MALAQPSTAIALLLRKPRSLWEHEQCRTFHETRCHRIAQSKPSLQSMSCCLTRHRLPHNLWEKVDYFYLLVPWILSAG